MNQSVVISQPVVREKEEVVVNDNHWVIQAEDLTKVYKMGEVEVHALRGVDLEVAAGELIVLLGASGSGKSTLLNILGGLDTPTAGEVRFEDHDLTAADETELTRYRREHVGFVFQFYNLIPSLTALENVALVTEIAAHPMEPLEALGRVGLADRRDHFPSQLSGGEQQMLAIGRALMSRPSILLLDEPSMGLSPVLVEAIFQIIQDIHEQGTTILLVEQNARRALGIAGRGYVLEVGRLRLAGSRDRLLDDPYVQGGFLR